MRSITLLICCFITISSQAQRLKVAENNRFLISEDGSPFFWLADTAWELIHRCDREEVDLYLQTRKDQGFTVIHTVILAELDGLNTPNPYGTTPLVDNDPTQPNPAYFEHVDYVLQKAEELGLYVALLPTWGDKLFKHNWGIGPEVFNTENAFFFGNWVGNRYQDHQNIIWVVGGDRNPRPESNDVEVWDAMAKGVTKGVGGSQQALITFHPQPTALGGSSQWFHENEWLDFNMHQTGHCPNRGTYQNILHDFNLSPTKPVIDGEPLYEDHPNCFNALEKGHSHARDIRRIMYQNVFAGAFGQSYGCHAVWQMWQPGREPINQPLRPWKEALHLPMANQAKHLKNLFLSRPFLTRIPDQSIILTEQAPNKFQKYRLATRDKDGSYAMIYFPTGEACELNLSKLMGKELNTWWYDPRTGAAFPGKPINASERQKVTPPSQGLGNDWVLVVDSQGLDFPVPGVPLKR